MSVVMEPLPPDSPDEARPPRSRVLAWVPWALMGWLVFELTADPALGVGFGCLKFGMGDLGTALWVWRHDPDRRRGRACSWFYVARACGVVGTTACFGMLTFHLVGAAVLGVPLLQKALQRELVAMLVVLLACFGLGAVVAWVGIASALLGKVRVWVDGTSARARRAGAWPPVDFSPPFVTGFSARVIASYGLATAPVGMMAVVLALGVTLGPWVAGGALAPAQFELVVLAALALAGVASLVGMALLFLRLDTFCAPSPSDCYPELLAVG